MKLEICQFFNVLSPLLEYRHNITSQCGEDGIIDRLIQLICPENKFCVEFGAWDGRHFSNCYNLIVNRKWTSIMIEANDVKYKELLSTYDGNKNVKSINKLVEFEGPNTLDNILNENGAPHDIGVLSIDIDGNDYYIFESLVDFRPEIIIIEFNPTIPNDVIFVQDKSFDINQGCSLLALIILAKQKGYELAVCTEWNAFFVKKEKFSILGIENNFISNIYTPLQNGRIFQGYDSSIHVTGMDRLLWKGGVAVSSEDFQVLPKATRVWEDAQRK